MFSTGSKLVAALARGMATSARGKERKVAVLGAAGGIGQPLSLLMKVRACSKPRGMREGRARDRAGVWVRRSGPAASARLGRPLFNSTLAIAPCALQMNPAVSQLSLYDVANVSVCMCMCLHAPVCVCVCVCVCV
jgi:malate dehydrogenase